MPDKTILLIEDDEDLIAIMTMALKARGYEVLSATDGDGGIQTALAQKPDLIIMDVHMLDMSGVEICRHLKSSPSTGHIPVILCTGDARQSAEALQKEAGSDGYIRKPFDMNELYASIEALISR